VLVTNGFINPVPLEQLIPHTDAMNIDLKSMRPEFYTHICKGMLDPVLDTIRRVAASTVHLEVTNLLIPGRNDSDEDIELLVDFVASLSRQIPLHFSAYHPDYKMEEPPTSAATVLRARIIALKKLDYVYIGNVRSDEGNDTICPACGHLLIKRSGYRTQVVGVSDGLCRKCNFATGIRQ
jgi:pyruvate formate lyase activating enzyme